MAELMTFADAAEAKAYYLKEGWTIVDVTTKEKLRAEYGPGVTVIRGADVKPLSAWQAWLLATRVLFAAIGLPRAPAWPRKLSSPNS